MTVHVPRRRARAEDVVVRWSGVVTAHALRDALSAHLGAPVPGLLHGGAPLGDDALVGRPPLLDGCSVAVGRGGTAGSAGAGPPALLTLVAVGGPDAGRAAPLRPPGLDVGRGERADLVLADPSLSRLHCRLEVGPDGVHVVDLGSTNGVMVDGEPIRTHTPVDTSSTLRIGATTLRLRRVAPPAPPVRLPGDGTVPVTPSAAPPPQLPAPELVAPRAPAPPARARVPWVAALAPVPVGVVLAVLLGPQALAFALLGPVVVLGTGLSDRFGARRRHREAVAGHDAPLARHALEVGAAAAEERRLRLLRHADPHRLLEVAERRGHDLWARPDDLTVRVGLGRCRAALASVDDRGADEHPVLDDVPVVLDLAEARALVLVGPREVTAGVLRHLVGQLVVRCPPSALTVAWHGPPQDDEALSRLLPHAPRPGHASPADAVARTVLVLPEAGAPSAATEAGRVLAAGGIVLVAAREERQVPALGATLLRCAGGGLVTGAAVGEGAPVLADAVGRAWFERLARALAPVREDVADEPPLPSDTRLGDLLGAEATDPRAVLRHWSQRHGPRAVVGLAPGRTVTLDLRRDGPHVLVGGTTGSGKSEFLRTLVTGLALGSSPDDLTLLLVDFKGGAAFDPCLGLPHVVGLVTDLDAHLVQRVLTSLAAELRRRERLLAEHRVTDLDDLPEHLPDGVRLPRLVVVVDELRALVDEHPDALSALVRLAAQGRSLGIHLVLATQRPAGTVTSEVQANVDLRIAFRVRDHADSVHVVESGEAARIPADAPGRGLARGGDGALSSFQAALVAPPRPGGSSVEVRAAATCRAPGRRLGSASGAAEDGERSASVRAVVDVVRQAFALSGTDPPRRPWLPPLPDHLEGSDLPADVVALVDEPDLQRRTPWPWTAETTLWRLVGAPRSGRTTALRALVHAAAGALPPDRLHVHVIGSDDALGDLTRLPHVGSVVRADDAAAVDAVLAHLESSAPGADDRLHRVLVVDGADRLDDVSGTTVGDRAARLVRDGRVVGMVAGGRELLRARWSALGGEVLVLGRPDPLDAALLGLRVEQTGGETPPGRGVRARDDREVQVVLRPDTGAWTGPPVDVRPWRYRPLPARVARSAVVPPAPDDPRGWLVGLAGATAAPWAWVPDRDGRRLLVTGAHGSGRSGLLRTVARSAASRGHPVALVRPTASGPARPGAKHPLAEVPGAEVPGVEVLGPGDAEHLVRLRREHPHLLVLVDDVHRLDDAPVRPVLEEVAELAERDSGAVVVTVPAAALAARFRGLDTTLARDGRGVLLRPGLDDATLLGLPRAALEPFLGGPPGRGVLVLDGTGTPLQVAHDDPADGVSPGRRTPRPARAP